MEIETIVNARIIAALRLFAAEKDVRGYLNGINLEIGPGETRLVATNGAMLGCFRVVSLQPDIKAPHNERHHPQRVAEKHQASRQRRAHPHRRAGICCRRAGRAVFVPGHADTSRRYRGRQDDSRRLPGLPTRHSRESFGRACAFRRQAARPAGEGRDDPARAEQAPCNDRAERRQRGGAYLPWPRRLHRRHQPAASRKNIRAD